MIPPIPPNYADVMREDESFLGNPEDLALASALFPNLRIYAALRPSEDSKKLVNV